MNNNGLVTSIDALPRVLRSTKDLCKGRKIYSWIRHNGIRITPVLAGNLIRMFALCGSLQEATDVFSRSPKSDRAVWHAIITAHINGSQSTQALMLYFQMQDEAHVSPDDYLFVAALKACTVSGCLVQGKIIHSHIIGSSSESDLYVGTTLIDLYARCRCLHDARKLFDGHSLSQRTVVMWNVMIAGYAQAGHFFEALLLFESMQEEEIKPDTVTLFSTLKACSGLVLSSLGDIIHAHILELSFNSDLSLSNSLIDMYCKCRRLHDARNLFDKLPIRSTITWNAILAGYAQDGHCMESFRLFQKMDQEGKTPDSVTLICYLRSFANPDLVDYGRHIHARIIESGLELDTLIGNSLIDMYSKCGCIADAHKLFEKRLTRDSVTWTVMIAGYAQCGLNHEALQYFYAMRQEGMEPDEVTYASVLKVCTCNNALHHGKIIHVGISFCHYKLSVLVSNAIADMYIKCGDLDDARKTFDEMHIRDVITWNTMISGYVQHGLGMEALMLVDRMHQEKLASNAITFVATVKACALTGALHQGKLMHTCIIESGLCYDEQTGSSLINFYGECGSLEDAYSVFKGLPKQDVVTWSAMIASYSLHKNYALAFQSYLDMRSEKLKPDGIIMVCLLSVCSHLGLIDEAYHHFSLMESEFGVKPTVEHYNCMVDLLGRTGHLHKAENLLESIPCQENVVGWRSLLGSCRTYGEVSLARRCFDTVRAIDSQNASAFALMFNIYVDANLWEDAEELKSSMKQSKTWKKPGRAYIEIDGEVRSFVVGEESHWLNDEFCGMLYRLHMQFVNEGCMLEFDTGFIQMCSKLYPTML